MKIKLIWIQIGGLLIEFTTIPLIDESKQLKHRLPKCPEVFRSELARKIE